MWYLSAGKAVIGNGCSDQLPDFKRCLVVFKTQDEIPTTTASANTLCLACSFVITCERTKQTVTHLYIFFSVGKRMCFQIPLSPVDPTDRGESRFYTTVPDTRTEAPMTLSVGFIIFIWWSNIQVVAGWFHEKLVGEIAIGSTIHWKIAISEYRVAQWATSSGVFHHLLFFQENKMWVCVSVFLLGK